jgi:NAD(P)-dependent dehydrogenase (short-subunit alcohol dehydrogenase family)
MPKKARRPREAGGIFAHCDVADPVSAAEALAASRAAHGAPAILVNCAGIGTAARVVGRDGPMPLEAFERVIRVNLLGTFNMMRLAAAEMSAAEPGVGGTRGVIISTASVAARRIRASGRGNGRERLSERRNRASRRRAQDAAGIGPFPGRYRLENAM